MAEDLYTSLTLEELKFLAEREGVKNTGPLTREELIEILEDIWEEKIADRKLNNDIMRLKGKKYDIYREDLNGSYHRMEYVIPENYPRTSIQLLLRDPFWTYAYWDINQFELQTILTACSDVQFFLRVYELQSRMDDLDEPLGSFDIPIKAEDSSWYINLPEPGMWYRVDLMYHAEGADTQILCRSGLLESPGGYWLSNTEELRRSPDSFKLFMAGYSNGIDHVNSNILIQKIVSDIDEANKNGPTEQQ